METSETAQGNAAFGSYLKKVREGRRLSLDAVEELSAGFPEKVTKSHLSRIENGLALPSFPRLMALSHIYGMPIASLAERYELDLRRGMTPVDLGVKSDEEVLAEIGKLRPSGRHSEALMLLLALLDRGHSRGTSKELEIRLHVVNCLVQLDRFEFAKALCEDLLSGGLPHLLRLICVQYFAICCSRLGRYTMAIMALEQVAAALDHPETTPRVEADLSAIRGNAYLSSGDVTRAISDLIHAKHAYASLPNLLEACRTGLALSEAYIEAARYEEAARELQDGLVLAETNGFERQQGIAYSHLCLLAYRQGQYERAETHAIRSNLIARPLEHTQVVFRNGYYLWRIALLRGDNGAVRVNERSLRTMLGRIEEQTPEATEFREFLSRGEHAQDV